jgi:microcystin-dependent protein
VAAFLDGAWVFHVPAEGWICWVANEDKAIVWSGTAWVDLATGGGGGGGGGFTDHGALTGLADDDHGQYHTDARGDARYYTKAQVDGAIAGHEADASAHALMGVNATANTTNRLSVASPASLFNHDGAGHQLKINKATAGNSASMLFQTGFSGRAEMGITGDDDFHFKVSADGATWNEAIVIDKDTGEVTFPNSTIGGGGGGSSGSGTAALIGAIIDWPTEALPSFALACDGAAYSRTTYSALFAKIGTRYGVGDGTTTFNVPDRRGEFVRGFANGSANDPDRASRTDRGDGTTGDNVGTKQADAFKSHRHGFTNTTFQSTAGTGRTAVNTATINVFTQFEGGSETRPRNVSTNYCIIFQ